MIKPPYGRQGNKMSIIEDLLQLIPQHTLYVEVFTGSGALFFNKEPTKSILNDLDEDVTYRLKLLKNVPLFKYKEIYSVEELKKIFDKPIHTLKDAVIHEKIKSNSGFRNIAITKSTEIYRVRNPYGITKNLPIYKELLKHATITQKDYIFILHKYDSPTTFFYLDPPYENTAKQFYSNVTINYEEMRDILSQLKGYFLLSINDSPYIHKVFREFIIKKINVRNQGYNGTSNNVKFRKELLIMNYTI